MSNSDFVREVLNNIHSHIDERDRQILEEVVNPVDSGIDIESNIGYLHVYYQKISNNDLLFNNIPNSWHQLSTNLEGATMWETQFLGKLTDRSLTESLIRQTLEGYKNSGIIGEYRIRYNYPPFEYEY